MCCSIITAYLSVASVWVSDGGFTVTGDNEGGVFPVDLGNATQRCFHSFTKAHADLDRPPNADNQQNTKIPS